jgi:sulfite reductase beta subunit-like hemoprotein
MTARPDALTASIRTLVQAHGADAVREAVRAEVGPVWDREAAILAAGTAMGLAPDEIDGVVADGVDAVLATARTTQDVKAEGWDEGHRVGWEHCQDGNYGSDYWDDDTPNPYRTGGAS